MMIESEIDKAFPYLDELNAKLKLLNENKLTKSTSLTTIFKLYKKEKRKLLTKKRRRTLNSKSHWKDGYDFTIKLQCIYDSKNCNNCYYEFFANIKYGFETREKEYYKKFYNIDKAKKYYNDIEGVFKNLKRRELMEKLFKEKESEIKKLEA